ncbi:MAG TPA: hypothetical protein PKZ20_14830 [Rhodocyclaceae bacterium]|jgi:hypothetical protein|nr:hypothetical protein [Rhodocyclaceae bacterium]
MLLDYDVIPDAAWEEGKALWEVGGTLELLPESLSVVPTARFVALWYVLSTNRENFKTYADFQVNVDAVLDAFKRHAHNPRMIAEIPSPIERISTDNRSIRTTIDGSMVADLSTNMFYSESEYSSVRSQLDAFLQKLGFNSGPDFRCAAKGRNVINLLAWLWGIPFDGIKRFPNAAAPITLEAGGRFEAVIDASKEQVLLMGNFGKVAHVSRVRATNFDEDVIIIRGSEDSPVVSQLEVWSLVRRAYPFNRIITYSNRFCRDVHGIYSAKQVNLLESDSVSSGELYSYIEDALLKEIAEGFSGNPTTRNATDMFFMMEQYRNLTNAFGEVGVVPQYSDKPYLHREEMIDWSRRMTAIARLRSC